MEKKIVQLKPATTDTAQIREMPHNIEAEQSLIGLLLVNNGYYGQVNEVLTEEHFYEPLHQRIYAAISKLIERGQVATPVVLKNIFDRDEALADIGGAKYLMQLAQMAVQIVDIKEMALLIHDLAMKRKLIEIGENMVVTAFKPDLDKDAKKQLEEAEASLFALATVGDTSRGFVQLGAPLKETLDMSESAMKRTRAVAGITTGFVDLDNLLGGLNPSDLLILAARPSMGKTALAINLAFNATKEVYAEAQAAGTKGCVGVFSLEMSAAQLTNRLLSMGSGPDDPGVDSNRIRKGDISEEEFTRLIRRSRRLSELPLFIDDTPALSISQVRTRARRLQRQHGLKLLVVDYLQLLHGSGRRSQESRVGEISEITQGLKAIAKELNIPVIALSQLSRAVEQREDKRPQLSDLRESGSIEQDADVVMFIYREEYYLVRKQPQEGTAEHAQWQADMDAVRNITEVFVAKQRNGPVDKVKLRFDGATTSFQNLAEGEA